MAENYVIWFENLRMTDVDRVGGKNASLGEMISQLTEKGVRVPGGFATTAEAYRAFLAHNGLSERISAALAALDVDDVNELARVGKEIRQWILETPFPEELDRAVEEAWNKMTADAGTAAISVAVRSSATAEDLPDASFAGQQETFLNINGLDNVKEAMKHVFASLYNDRAISYRVHKGFAHDIVALSAGVQRMVRSDSGASGVMFTLDTESGFDQVVFVTSSYGLGEMVVQGAVNPDEFYVHKPTLRAGRPAVLRKTMGSKLIKMVFTEQAQAGKSVQVVDVPAEQRKQFSISNEEITELAQYALIIEEHYGRPMDIEWGRDGVDGKIYILQARPETVKSQEESGRSLRRYTISGEKKVLAEGRAIGQKVGQGKVRLVKDASEMDSVKEGDVLVTDMTDPDWEPVMKRGDYCARIGYSGRSRLRQRLFHPAGRPGSNGFLCRRRHRLYLQRFAGCGSQRHRFGQHARIAGENHDERRQSRIGLLVLRPAQRRHRLGAYGIYHQPPNRHPSESIA